MKKKLLLGALAAASVAAVPVLPSVATAGGGDASARPGGASQPSAVAAKRTSCDPNYKGRCLRRNAGDYDCAGGSGNGPNYVSGPFRVVGSDIHRLDSDRDGIACE